MRKAFKLVDTYSWIIRNFSEYYNYPTTNFKLDIIILFHSIEM